MNAQLTPPKNDWRHINSYVTCLYCTVHLLNRRTLIIADLIFEKNLICCEKDVQFQSLGLDMHPLMCPDLWNQNTSEKKTSKMLRHSLTYCNHNACTHTFNHQLKERRECEIAPIQYKYSPGMTLCQDIHLYCVFNRCLNYHTMFLLLMSPRYTTTFIWGAQSWISLCQETSVERGTTTRKGPYSWWSLNM